LWLSPHWSFWRFSPPGFYWSRYRFLYVNRWEIIDPDTTFKMSKCGVNGCCSAHYILLVWIDVSPAWARKSSSCRKFPRFTSPLITSELGSGESKGTDSLLDPLKAIPCRPHLTKVRIIDCSLLDTNCIWLRCEAFNTHWLLPATSLGVHIWCRNVSITVEVSLLMLHQIFNSAVVCPWFR
jgi:hypothetical protein